MIKDLSRLSSVEALLDYRLAIEWADGRKMTLDFNETLASGPVFAPLRQVASFRTVRLGERRRSIEWPEPADERGQPLIEIDADGLLAMGFEQAPRVGLAS